MQDNIFVYNTLGRTKELFKPIKPGHVGMYCCGPTVYNYAHIGNLRTYIFEDVVRRTLELAGYTVNHVVNITDVGHLTSDGDEGEDKVIQAARAQGLSVEQMANFFSEAFFADCQKLNIKPAHHYPKASHYIQQMIHFIENLERKGFTYQSQGNVYFDTSKDPNYGALRGYREVNSAQSRVEQDGAKRFASDFVLWFTNSKFTDQAMQWQSPWGVGYPGWHLECSAISQDLLSSRFDVHCGGIDHIAIHHTNEMAQNYGCTQHIGANYWLHGEFLVLDQMQKMSKSTGTFLTLNSLEANSVPALAYRYFVLQSHYRKPLTFSQLALEGAMQAWRRLRLRTQSLIGRKPSYTLASELWVNKAKAAIFDDFNTPELLALLWQGLKSTELTDDEKLALVLEVDKVLALSLLDLPESDCADEHELGQEDVIRIEQLIRQRNTARAAKDFAKADDIRNQLMSLGIVLKDGSSGTTWHQQE